MSADQCTLDLVHAVPAEAEMTLGGFATRDEFAAFYERTARPLRGYLGRVVRNDARADDLLQESYLRLMRASVDPSTGLAYRRNYLYRIATNLIHDHYRATRREGEMPEDVPAAQNPAELTHDLRDALDAISARDRQILWLAYAERFSHREIAEITGLKEQSLRPMLLRARARLAAELRQRGYAS
jgi:RNA polymerase sigma-70 factor (ECF subfamily)